MNFNKDEVIKELVKKANDSTSWKTRLEALNAIKEIDCQQRTDVIIRLALHDKVYKVKETAFRIAQELNLKKGGKSIFLGKKDIGYNSKDFTKIFLRVKRETGMEELQLDIFKDKFNQINPEMFDVMCYEKDNKFDDWIEKLYISLPKKSKYIDLFWNNIKNFCN